MKTLLISACLTGVNCKYSGGNNYIGSEQMEKLSEKYRLIPVCPEVDGGLPVPRNPAEIINGKVINSEGQDVSVQFRRGAEIALAKAIENNCKTALMKACSPSCGNGRIYDGSFSHRLIHGDGVTAGLLKKNGVCVYNEEELNEII